MRVYFLLNYLFFLVSKDPKATIDENGYQYQDNTEDEIENNNQIVQYDQTQNLSDNYNYNNTIYQTLIFTGTTTSLSKLDECIITITVIGIIFFTINLIEQYNSSLNDVNTQIQHNRTKQLINNINSDIEQKIKQKIDIVDALNQERQFHVNRILNNTFNNINQHSNHVPYVQNVQNTQQMFQVYGIKNLVSKKTLIQICTKFRPVKGDGNSLYTAFGFQYLSLLLLEYDDQSFQQVLMKYKNLRFRISTKLGFKIDNLNNEKLLREEFYYRLQQLRQIEDLHKRKEAFFIQFSINDDNDQFLHSLSIIFFRNLVYSLFEKDQDHLQCDSILIWEQECENDEYLIKLLSEELNVTSQVVQFDGEFITTIYYNEQYLPLFILLLKQGHYSIGKQ